MSLEFNLESKIHDGCHCFFLTIVSNYSLNRPPPLDRTNQKPINKKFWFNFKQLILIGI